MSSTDGSATYTCWKRRSRAGSFSTCLRYSSSVVAPIIRSSPRASIGLIMLPASIAPSAAPAPTIVCSSSTNVMTSPAASVISLRTAFSRSSNSPRYLAPAIIEPMSRAIEALVLQALGHVAVGDAPGEALDDGGLADAGLADQHGVVLRAPREHLDDAADLVVAADDRVDLAVAGAGREVLAVALERLELLLGVLRRDAVRAAHLLQHLQQLLGADAEALVHGEQQVLDGQEVVAQVLLEALGRVEDLVQLAARGAARRRRRPWAAWRRPRRPCCAPSAAPGRAWPARPGRPCRPAAVRAASRWSGVSSGLELPLAWSMAAAIASWVLSVHFLGSSAMRPVLPADRKLESHRIKFAPSRRRAPPG